MKKLICKLFGHKQEKPKPQPIGWLGYSVFCVRCKEPLFEVVEPKTK